MLMLFSRRIASRWIQLQIQRSVWLKLEEGSTSFSTTHSVHSKRMRRKQQINNLVLQPTDTPCRKWTAGTSPPPPVDTPCQDGTLACDPHYRNHHQHTAGQLRYHPVELQSGDSLPTPTCLHINRTTRKLLLYLQENQSWRGTLWTGKGLFILFNSKLLIWFFGIKLNEFVCTGKPV